jgi:hypothetical protein
LIFLFSVATQAFSYIDVKQLRLDQITNGDYGNLWIFVKRQKTETHCHIPLLDEAKVILARHTLQPLIEIINVGTNS